MAAIAAVVETLPLGAKVVAPVDAYSGTRRLLSDLEEHGRVRRALVDITDVQATLTACADSDLLWLESPTNPMMRVADLARLTAGAHESGALVAVDNTFATPLLQRPLSLGADFVVHSVTKLLAGHSAVVLGAVVTPEHRDDLNDVIAQHRQMRGAIPGPLEAYLALMGIRTLAVRLDRAQANAAELASRLESRAGVAQVMYPGLPSHPDHALATRQMDGFGTMISFLMADGMTAADSVCRGVRLCTPGTSLGGVETLIERRARWSGEEGVPPGLIRLSVGIEDVEDLWADLDHAIASI